MKKLLDTLRLTMAETFLGWAVTVAPKGHPDSARLAQAVLDYLAGCRRPGKR